MEEKGRQTGKERGRKELTENKNRKRRKRREIRS